MSRRGRNQVLTTLAIVGLAGVMVVSPACEKKKPPPPPPPRDTTPPPPPPPATVHLVSLMSGMSLDARVQVAEGVEVLDDRLGRAILEFADALVGGDPSEVRKWLSGSSSGRGVLDELLNTGEWDEAVSMIEAVRIVYAQDGGASDEPSPVDEAETYMKRLEDKVRDRVASPDPIDAQFIMALFEELPDEAKQMMAGVQGMMQSMPAISDPQAKQMFLTQILRGLDVGRQQLDQMVSSFSGDSVTIAIQTPGEAFLTRWAIGRAGSSFVFSGLESIADVRPRASDFDGVSGELRFAGPSLPSLPVDFGGGAGGLPPPPPPTTTPSDSPSGPTRRTPSGPITIPGG